MSSVAHFAVLQKTSGMLNADALKRAFSSFVNLTDADAIRLAVTSRGVLMRQLDRDAARALHRALESEGIAAEMVREDEMPSLPEAHLLRRIQFSPQALIAYDLLGRPAPLDWERIALVAAGAVRDFEIAKTQTERKEMRLSAVSGIGTKTITETAHRVDTDFKLVLALILHGGRGHYRIEANDFPFKYVIDRPELSVAAKFNWLVREICRNAPRAVLNYGAKAISGGSDSIAEYASRQTFADEMIWLLWSGAAKQ